MHSPPALVADAASCAGGSVAVPKGLANGCKYPIHLPPASRRLCFFPPCQKRPLRLPVRSGSPQISLWQEHPQGSPGCARNLQRPTTPYAAFLTLVFVPNRERCTGSVRDLGEASGWWGPNLCVLACQRRQGKPYFRFFDDEDFLVRLRVSRAMGMGSPMIFLVKSRKRQMSGGTLLEKSQMESTK